MGDTERHLATWRAAGLIDDATAERIATWDAGEVAGHAPSNRPSIVTILGPGVSIGEMFAYLGVAFLLAATDVFLGRSVTSSNGDMILAVGSAIQAVVLFAIGLSLLGGDARRRRAAGVAFLVATTHAGVAAWFMSQAIGIQDELAGVLAGAVATLVAAAARRRHPALTTQAALLGAITYLWYSLLMWIEAALFGSPTFTSSEPVHTQQEQLLMTIGSAAWWLLSGVVIGLIGLFESRQEGRAEGAEYRAGLTRLWAGILAISGFCNAVTRSDLLADGTYGRVVEPWIAQVAILVVSVILIERAFRRSSAAFVVAGALGMIVALTDFNFSYLSDQTEVGLLIEGLILLAVGFFADRIRRRLGNGRADADQVPPPPMPPRSDQPAPVAAPGE